MRLFITFCIMLLALAACRNSREFAKPTPESLQLGYVTQADILRDYGRPLAQRSNMIGSSAENPGVNGTFTTWNYGYTNPGEAFLLGAHAGSKFIVFSFFNEKLYAYNFVSERDSDSSNFDERKIEHFENGVTTRQDVEDLLGPPSGRAIFPSPDVAVGEEKSIYQYSVRGLEISSKRMELIFTDRDKLKNFSYSSRGTPPPPPNSRVMIPETSGQQP